MTAIEDAARDLILHGNDHTGSHDPNRDATGCVPCVIAYQRRYTVLDRAVRAETGHHTPVPDGSPPPA